MPIVPERCKRPKRHCSNGRLATKFPERRWILHLSLVQGELPQCACWSLKSPRAVVSSCSVVFGSAVDAQHAHKICNLLQVTDGVARAFVIPAQNVCEKDVLP